jgi:hypothetical protein
MLMNLYVLKFSLLLNKERKKEGRKEIIVAQISGRKHTFSFG